MGYYAHLITDAAFQGFIRDEKRVRDVWGRIKADSFLQEEAKGYPEDWDSVKKLISKSARMNEIYTMEAEYLKENPDSGYLTEIMSLREFPDYIDYLPKGAIVRKISVMGYWPKKELGEFPFIMMTREEYETFLNEATEQIVRGIICR